MSRILPLCDLRRAHVDDAGFAYGVFSGIAYWLGLPAWIVRTAGVVGALALSLWGGAFGLPISVDLTLAELHFDFDIAPFIIMYLAAGIFMPEWEQLPQDFEDRTGVETSRIQA